MKSKLPTNLEGYRAASIIILNALNKAEKERPKRSTLKIYNSAAFREGYYTGLLVAHCQHTLGEYPSFNVEAIKQALSQT